MYLEGIEARSDAGAASNSDGEDSTDSEEELDDPENENEEEDNRYCYARITKKLIIIRI